MNVKVRAESKQISGISNSRKSAESFHDRIRLLASRLFILPFGTTVKRERVPRCCCVKERSTLLHVEKPTEVPSSSSELKLPACGETAAKLISVGGRRFKRLPAGGGDVEHATMAALRGTMATLRGIDDDRACGGSLRWRAWDVGADESVSALTVVTTGIAEKLRAATYHDEPS